MGNATVGLLVALCFAPDTALPAADEAALPGPHGLAPDGAGNLLVSCRGGKSVVVLSRDGREIRRFGEGKLDRPGGLCMLADGRVVVANTARNELAVFDAAGRFLATAAGGLAAPEDVAAGPDGRVYVADTGNSRVAVLDPKLEKVLFAIEQAGEPPSRLKAPAGVAVADGRLIVADTGNGRVLTMPLPADTDGARRAATIAHDSMKTPRFVAAGRDGSVYVADGKHVRGFDRDGKPRGAFGAKVMRVTISDLFQPAGLAVDEAENVLAVDRYTARIFVTDASLTDPSPRVVTDPKDPTTVAIEWATPSPQLTVVEYGKTDDYGLRFADDRPATLHRAALKGLAPATRYCFRIRKPFEMIPESAPAKPGFSLRHQKKFHARLFEANVSGNHTFATLPEAGKTDWASLPVIVLVCRNVKFPPRDGKQPPSRVLDDDDVALLKSELETYRTWAWRQSGCKLNLDFTYVQVHAERDHNRLGALGKEVFDDVLQGIRAQGKDLHAFWNVLVVGTHGWYALYLDGPSAGSDYELCSCYTGFGHGQKPGWWWFPVHEHGHLIHSIFMNSELETFAFPDAPWTMPGQFGEDFSFLAANYRRQAPRSWLALRTAVLNQSADTNANGVPDDDPRVPLDEKRFGWNAGLGTDCMARIRAGIRDICIPGDRDTDFDGKVHKLNPGELNWVDRRIPKAAPTLDGRLANGEWREVYSIPNVTTPARCRGLKGRLFVAWDDGQYYFAVQTDRPAVAAFDLDGANDGWFHGRDNLRFSVRPPSGGRKIEATGAIWDFLNDRINLHKGQHWYRDAYGPGDIRAAAGRQVGWYVIECAVPARPDVRIAPGPSARFALRARVSPADPKAPFDPTDFFDGEEFLYNLQCAGGAK